MGKCKFNVVLILYFTATESNGKCRKPKRPAPEPPLHAQRTRKQEQALQAKSVAHRSNLRSNTFVQNDESSELPTVVIDSRTSKSSRPLSPPQAPPKPSRTGHNSSSAPNTPATTNRHLLHKAPSTPQPYHVHRAASCEPTRTTSGSPPLHTTAARKSKTWHPAHTSGESRAAKFISSITSSLGSHISAVKTSTAIATKISSTDSVSPAPKITKVLSKGTPPPRPSLPHPKHQPHPNDNGDEGYVHMSSYTDHHDYCEIDQFIGSTSTKATAKPPTNSSGIYASINTTTRDAGNYMVKIDQWGMMMHPAVGVLN